MRKSVKDSYKNQEKISEENFQKARFNHKMRDFYRILDPKLGEGAYGEVR
jgi:hypothetical protein